MSWVVLSNTLEAYGNRTVYLVPEEDVLKDEKGREYCHSSGGYCDHHRNNKFPVKRDIDGKAVTEVFFSIGD